ncbi:MAG: 16S rRNA (cytosine(1402)-N(4))-methyltransferase RsmH [Saprospiraceae bacterium]|nr:16S rRNA (cytosine(1402)-N(4))-methyltransferase RsmH [Saprospiraceae bacterium]MCF8250581.1 16S rRNA (cytosine(1402)-N(4))-methyltransferase RsmH [Saprospiraceae bacterium]MCF8281397.1 16S rRNA (cytosine(1402)-N(4))-methyltransferase RsmH [Bacteroidales bacterium]MCF8313100.1 16S rRNA (cytosine(1402)-N(4))-methyltransferase RsmH [Saprospiraceae bacterium]MCF8441536.1 16S rRNA (cytosine(1402)-N(4))-methyltransferase RsmH [Saprospiraceae bacterium]
MAYHIPILAKESIEALAIKKDGVYLDATFGGGGHSRLILNELGKNGRLFAFDQDDDSLRNLIDDERFVFNHHNFRYMKQFLRLHGVKQVDGILADLGVSSHQLNEAERGFSFRFEADLDMRMNRSEETTAATVLKTYSADALQTLFSEYGEVRNAKSLAQKIVQERGHRPIRTIGDLLGIIEPLVRGHKNRYLAQVFQALRIEVNDEMGALREFLEATLEVLKPGGRLVVISFHSLEDRMVKNLLKTGNVEGEKKSDFYGKIERPFEQINKGVITPSEDEMAKNTRARSAKMRIGLRR